MTVVPFLYSVFLSLSLIYDQCKCRDSLLNMNSVVSQKVILLASSCSGSYEIITGCVQFYSVCLCVPYCTG